MSSESAQILLVPMGTPGDVQPFIDLGAGLLAAGMPATLVAHEPFRERAEAVGLGFTPLGSKADYDLVLDDKNLWSKTKAHRVFHRKFVGPSMRPMYRAIEAAHVTGPIVVIGQSMAIGARVAQDKLGVPTITLHRQPSLIPSVYESSVTPMTFLPGWLPRPLKRAQLRLLDKIIDHTFLPDTNAFRAELGLSPVRHLIDWLHSPTSVVGTWPAWFAAPQPDWPANVELVGFNPHERGERAADEPLQSFIAEHGRPIVFTAGSGMRHADRFFRECVKTCVELDRAGVIVTRKREQLPAELPANVMHAAYAPFGSLFARAAAVVHHGGIGTVSQGLVAGVPQLSVPGLVFDTFDTAARLKRLGVGETVPMSRFTATRAAEKLRAMLGDEAMKDRCRAFGERARQDDPVAAVVAKVKSLPLKR